MQGFNLADGGQVQLQFTGYDGFPYEVQVSSDLQSWTTLGTAHPTNGVLMVTDPVGSTLNQRFYRSSLAP